MPSNRLARLAVPVIVVIVVIMMVVPLPAALLDILIASNMAMALVVLLVAMQVSKPLDFAVFPTLVLVGTILRLALNVSSTRLVLRDGYASHVIDAFGHIVIGGSLVIGLVVFAILVIIQLTVVTNGAARVAEVGARFTLDAMPGKQMAIDADLNSGLIDENEARRRRKEVAAEADSAQDPSSAAPAGMAARAQRAYAVPPVVPPVVPPAATAAAPAAAPAGPVNQPVLAPQTRGVLADRARSAERTSGNAQAREQAAAEQRLAGDRRTLRTLGVPSAWTRRMRAGDRFAAVLRMLERMPDVDIDPEVEVVALVGPRGAVQLEAHRTALDLPLDDRPRPVVVVPRDGRSRGPAIAKANKLGTVVGVAGINRLIADYRVQVDRGNGSSRCWTPSTTSSTRAFPCRPRQTRPRTVPLVDGALPPHPGHPHPA
jgi:hypothetical protein